MRVSSFSVRSVSLSSLLLGLAACSSSHAALPPATQVLSSLDSSRAALRIASHPAHHVCTDNSPGAVRCHAWLRDDAQQSSGSVTPAAIAGYHPADLQAAYALASTTAGAGRTVAIVDAYDDPRAESDLKIYRSMFGLPPCTSANGCFKKVNQSGIVGRSPSPNTGWAQEISLDLDMVSAICPNCHILLVEAASSSWSNLVIAVNTAAKAAPSAISNSYGGSESSGELKFAASYNHPGIAITASSGDNGFGVEAPAAFSSVTAVGGTSLYTNAGSTRGWSESAWSGAGAGCSAYVSKPSWQTDAGCPMRSVADVSAVADPNTGVAVYDSYGPPSQTGWLVFGGTSVSSPLVASVYALAGNTAHLSYGSYPYGQAFSLFDVTAGSDGTCSVSYLCTAGVGYDGPTGLGTPNGAGAF